MPPVVLTVLLLPSARQGLLEQDIVINFPEHGLHLRFEPRSQRLRLIEVYDVSRLQARTPLAPTPCSLVPARHRGGPSSCRTGPAHTEGTSYELWRVARHAHEGAMQPSCACRVQAWRWHVEQLLLQAAHGNTCRLLRDVTCGSCVSMQQVKYGSALIGGASHPATFARVYDTCGPTYPGEFDAAAGAYTLHYPGVAFRFPIPPQHAQRCGESQVPVPLDRPLHCVVIGAVQPCSTVPR